MTGQRGGGGGSSRWATIAGWLAIALVVVLLVQHGQNLHRAREGFVDEKQEFKLMRGPEVYDDFYVSVYDDLLYNSVKNDYEVGHIVSSTKPTEKSVILDIGSGTGHHVGALASAGLDATGLDISPDMVQAASKNYPGSVFKQGDALHGGLFNPSTYTHISCLYFTIYYIQDKATFLRNCYTWLMPGGYLVLHLVDRTAFDPMVPAGAPLLAIDPQRYSAERLTKTAVEFDTHAYTADFTLDEDGDMATFTEVFKPKVGAVTRKNTHELYMPSQQEIIRQAREAGFIVQSVTEMARCRYEGQYLYVLQKPS